MKRLFKNIICAVLAPVALVSCMDLDENVYDKLPTDEFGTTEKQINAIMAPAYQSLKNMLAYDGPWGAADMTADILIAPTRVGGDWWDGGQYMEQCMHSWKPNSYSVENCWTYCTEGLTTVNSVYNIIEKSDAFFSSTARNVPRIKTSIVTTNTQKKKVFNIPSPISPLRPQ